jgi:hypothetical protein
MESETVPLSSGELAITQIDADNRLKVVALSGDYISYHYTPDTEWVVEHNLTSDITGVIPQFYIDYPQKDFEIIHNLGTTDLLI